MKSLAAIKRASLALVALSAMGVTHSALAAGTASGTSIDNTATVNYSVGSVAQTAVTSNTSSFVVDSKVDMSVAGGSTTTTVPSATGVAVAFTVTNEGNVSDTYALTTANATGDGFDVSSLTIYADTDSSGTYNAGDTAITSLTLAAGASKTVFVVSTMPSTATNGQSANVTLTATTSLTASTGADGASTVEVVYADGTDYNGYETGTDTYSISTATLSVVKSATVVSDPINGTTNPKAIPGATVRYSIVVTNNGAASATSVTLTDTIPTNTTYVASSMKLGSTALTDSSADGDGASTTGSPVTSISVDAGTVAASGSATVTFDVTID